MWFNSTNVIPLGNGRLGAQVLGQVPEEVIILNEDRIWSGSLNDPDNKNCSQALPAFREYLGLTVRPGKTISTTRKRLPMRSVWRHLSVNRCTKVRVYCTPLTKVDPYGLSAAGNLSLATSHSGIISNYNHSLDFTTAISTTTYAYEGVRYTRTAFASHPDNVIVIRMSANTTGSITFDASFETPMGIPVSAVSCIQGYAIQHSIYRHFLPMGEI
ncbi:glycosyl hydrolase family, N-terminal domain-containing protein [Lentinula boryana]|uniref:Glycosyl hydrolase family, N-terminal domain-containing protein n=1 Tax=Lentinula boryana TaxID=40481 RepID=A0ABQ8QQ96_9AGAR|nr:glycosyl hydrolase family, N-terminal domain-containing protein [Lentinula boryana]